jgi:integrase
LTERITETLVKKLLSPPSGNKITYDSDLKGFGVRATASGAKAFVLNYRSAGRERRFTIGSYPEWSATAARKRAEDLKRKIDLGQDPLAHRREDRAALKIKQLCELYAERHLPKKRERSQRDDMAIIRTIVLPRLGNMKAAAVRYDDIDSLHQDISARAPYRANRAVALLSKIFSLAIKWEILTENPAKGIDKNPEQLRNRYLQPAEFERLMGTLDLWPNRPIAHAVLLLMLTGARRSEVLKATWDQFDLSGGLWTKPAASVKQARVHRVPLSTVAIGLLKEMKSCGRSSEFLFPSRNSNQPIGDIKKSWAAICKKAEVKGVRIHDLRHTYASHLVSAGHSLPIIGALLGHTQAQTTHRYAHLLDDPLRAATEQMASIMTRHAK